MKQFLHAISPYWQPHRGQREFLECPARIRVLACGRRWGKTDACAASILAALGSDRPTKHLILAPTLDQANLLFDRVIELLEALEPEAKTSVRRSPYPRLRYGDHLVTARSGHLGRALRGNEATHIIVDEAAYVPEELVTEVAMPMLATNNGRLTLISTPNGLNHFWRFYQLGIEGKHGVWSRTAPSSESPHVSADFLEVQRQLISERAFATEYEAQFDEADGAVFSKEMIDACLVPRIALDDDPIVIGIDWGRYSDFTAVAVMQGFRQDCRLLETRFFNQRNWQAQTDEVARIVNRYPGATVVADGTGSGDAVIDMLTPKIHDRPVAPVTFTNPVKRQLIEGLRALMETKALLFVSEPELVRQLLHFESRVTAAGNTKMESRSGYHDDLVIALALACSHLVRQYSGAVHVGVERGIRHIFRSTPLRLPKSPFEPESWLQFHRP
ncbi:MAG: hypothetical protein IT203_05140 [Fimbriimonadaceae bacterium]|nr:hypothetical protein [Fimbriimonadaceae bacterium]